MLKGLHLIIASICVTTISSLRCQKTSGDGPKPNLDCVFPFKLGGKEYNECTDVNAFDKKLWCSTKTDPNGNHLKGNWGNCAEDCQEIDGDIQKRNQHSGDLRCERTNAEGPQKNQLCVYPFILAGKEWNGCTNATDPNGKFWCSTKVDSQKIHQRGNWGFCDPNCNAALSESTSTTDTTTSTTTTTVVTTTIAFEPFDDQNNEEFDGTQLPSAEDEKNYCGAEQTQGFIVGGKEAKIGSFPFIAALGIFNPKNATNIIYTCGGSLINRRYVVTAAHCQSQLNPLVDVLLGEHDFSREPDCSDVGCKSVLQHFPIDKSNVIVHPQFNIAKFSQGYDIALIRLPRLANTVIQDAVSRVLPICLAWNPSITLPTEKHQVAGWGRSSTNRFDSGTLLITGASTSILQQLDVPLVPFEICLESFRDQPISDENHICAGGEPGKDSCSGDSGGPLIARTEDGRNGIMFLEGVVSFGASTCSGNSPGVYTRVSKYIEWIRSNMKP